MDFISTLLLGLAASEAWAVPQNFLGAGGGGVSIPICHWKAKPVTANTEVRAGEAELLSWTCTSNPVSGCGLTDSATYTHSTTWNVGGGLSANFEVGEVGDLTPSFQFGYSWTDSSGKSQSASVDCPEGGIRCGLIVTPYLCKITGDAEPTRDEPLRAQHCSDMPGRSSYEVESVCMRGDSKNNDMNAVTDFEACVLECNEDDKCDKNKANQMKPCPGAQKFPF